MTDDSNFDFTRLHDEWFFHVAFCFGLRFHSFQFQVFYDCVEQIVQSPTVLGGDGFGYRLVDGLAEAAA